MSEDSTQSFSNAFKKFLKSENLEQTFQEKKLIQSWEKIMGKPIAARTLKLWIKDGTMYVHLSSAPLKQELTNNREKVLELIEKEMGKRVVDKIRFV